MAQATVRQALLYVQTMQQIEKATKKGQAARLNIQLLQRLFDVPRRVLLNEDAVDLFAAAKIVHFSMQRVILPKFSLLADNTEPVEASIFDDLDREEDAAAGVEPEDTSPWKIHERNIEAVMRLAIRVFRDSYSGVQQAELVPLLEHIAYEIDQKDG